MAHAMPKQAWPWSSWCAVYGDFAGWAVRLGLSVVGLAGWFGQFGSVGLSGCLGWLVRWVGLVWLVGLLFAALPGLVKRVGSTPDTQNGTCPTPNETGQKSDAKFASCIYEFAPVSNVVIWVAAHANKNSVMSIAFLAICAALAMNNARRPPITAAASNVMIGFAALAN